MNTDVITRQRSFGATLLGPKRTNFRFWAPDCKTVSVEFEDGAPVSMHPVGDGWFEAEATCGVGTVYRYRISNDLAVPDPAADAQSDDAHGGSVVIDHAAYHWKHADWAGRPWHEAVIYELHVGTFGGFKGVTAQLPHLARLGVSVIELMPVADFPGKRNWGYDGVLIYAPDTSYGTPDDLKELVDTAHGLGLMMMLDVVYNHFGPDGNYLGAYASDFYRHDRTTPWGDALDFRREPVRRFFIENALSWLVEFQFDGLRFDAVHAIADAEFLHTLSHEIRAGVDPGRHIHLVLENEENEAFLLRPDGDQPGYDAQWADDLHHCVHVLLTGETEAYYEDYADHPAEHLARCLQDGFAFQGEIRKHSGLRRGSPSGHLPPTSFVICLQNHDQIGNRPFGERLTVLADPDALRAATVLLLLGPQIPLVFMGQEWATPAPFLYFASHHEELAAAVRIGRTEEFARFSMFNDPAHRNAIPDPNHPDSYKRSTPDLAETEIPKHAEWVEFHRTLLSIRKAEIMPRLEGARSIEALALDPHSVRASWRMGDGSTLTMAVNFGTERTLCPALAGRVLFASRPRSSPDSLEPRSAEVTLQDAADA